ncbi:hypothetical protein QJS04_geneDACA013674 [Acorus gramineus]|uniref:Uncharacterized protein n=1 Tax=Acorus gramineus TaxID=55184 RepID=A0AAV9AZI7_ACOGR|nr:hypothetical protein QJS04_geneDACA013674 [Acorus gramineus]
MRQAGVIQVFLLLLSLTFSSLAAAPPGFQCGVPEAALRECHDFLAILHDDPKDSWRKHHNIGVYCCLWSHKLDPKCFTRKEYITVTVLCAPYRPSSSLLAGRA